MTDPKKDSYDMGRLRWQCRRGMLELDYLLLEFLEGQFSALSEAEKADFVRLLGESDQDLQRWLVSGHTPADAAFARLVRKLLDGRQAAGAPPT